MKSLIRKAVIYLIFITMTVGCVFFSNYPYVDVYLLDWERKPSSVYIEYKIKNTCKGLVRGVTVSFLIDIENASYLIAKDYCDKDLYPDEILLVGFECPVEGSLNVISVRFEFYTIDTYNKLGACESSY